MVSDFLKNFSIKLCHEYLIVFSVVTVIQQPSAIVEYMCITKITSKKEETSDLHQGDEAHHLRNSR